MSEDEKSSTAASPVLAAGSWSMQSQIQALARDAVQLSTLAESECCFTCQKSCTARRFPQHLCRMKWPWLFCHADLTQLTHPLQWTVSSGRKSWREKFVFFSKPVCIYWSKRARLGHSSGWCSCQTEGTNLSISNIPVGTAQMIHFWMTPVVQWRLKDWGRNWVLKINCEGVRPLGLPFFETVTP